MNDTTSVVEILEQIRKDLRALFVEQMDEVIKALKKIDKNTEKKVDQTL